MMSESGTSLTKELSYTKSFEDMFDEIDRENMDESSVAGNNECDENFETSTHEPDLLRNLGTGFSDLSLDADLNDLRNTVHDQLIELDENLVDRSVEEQNSICTECLLNDDNFRSTEIPYEPLERYEVNTKEDESRGCIALTTVDQVTEIIESSNPLTAINNIDFAENMICPTLNKFSEDKTLSTLVDWHQRLVQRYDKALPGTKICPEQSADVVQSRKRSIDDSSPRVLQSSITIQTEENKAIKKIKSADNMTVGRSPKKMSQKSKEYLTRNESPLKSCNSHFQSSNKPTRNNSAALGISSPTSKSLGIEAADNELVWNSVQNLIPAGKLDQIRQLVLEIESQNLPESQMNCYRVKSITNESDAVTNIVPINNMNVEQTDVPINPVVHQNDESNSLSDLEICIEDAALDFSPTSWAEYMSSQANHKEFIPVANHETASKNEVSISEPKLPTSSQVMAVEINAQNHLHVDKNQSSIPLADELRRKTSDLDDDDIETDMIGCPIEFDSDFVLEAQSATVVKDTTNNVPPESHIILANNNTPCNEAKIVDEENNFNSLFITESQMIQIERDAAGIATNSSQPTGLPQLNDFNSQFLTESQWQTIDETERRAYSATHSVSENNKLSSPKKVEEYDSRVNTMEIATVSATDDRRALLQKNVDGTKNIATVNPNVGINDELMSGFLSESQLKHIDTEVAAAASDAGWVNTTENDISVEIRPLSGKVNSSDMFYKPEQKNRLTHQSNNEFSLPYWVHTPIPIIDYEKIQSIIRTRRQQVKRMLQEIRHLSSTVANLKQIFEPEKINVNAELPPPSHPVIRHLNQFHFTGTLPINPQSKDCATNICAIKPNSQYLKPEASESELCNPTIFHPSSSIKKPQNNASSFFCAQENSQSLRGREAANIFGALKHSLSDMRNDKPETLGVWFNSRDLASCHSGNINSSHTLPIATSATPTVQNTSSVIPNNGAKINVAYENNNKCLVDTMFYSGDDE